MISVLENYSDAKTIERVKSSLQNIKQDSANTGFIFPQTYYNKYDKLLNYKTPRSLIPKLESIESYLLDKVNKLVMQEIKSKRIGIIEKEKTTIIEEKKKPSFDNMVLSILFTFK
jgi:hypothetical protein